MLGNVVVHAGIICRQWGTTIGMLPCYYVICRTVFNLINSQVDLFISQNAKTSKSDPYSHLPGVASHIISV